MLQDTIRQIPLHLIICRDQVRKRFDAESLAALAQSIGALGQQEPVHLVAVDDGKYRVLTGERRVRAAKQSGQTTIWGIVEQAGMSAGDILLRQLTENMQRADLNPTEKAKGIDALMKEMGWNASQAASKLGLTNGTVSKLLSLLSLPEELQMRIDAGELPATTAYQLSKLDDPEAQRTLASQVLSGELTRDKVIGAVKATKQQKRRARKPRPIRVTAKLENRETVSVAADALDLNSFVLILEKLLTHAQQARTDGLTLQALVKRLSSPQLLAPTGGRAA
jgi:ParB family chromosome partitioning protein